MSTIRPKVRVLGLASLVLLLAFSAVSADVRIEKRLALAPGGKLALDTDAGSITIMGSAGSDAHVVITSKDDDLEKHFKFEFLESPGAVGVSARRVSRTQVRNVSLHFEIEVPKSTSVEAETAGGSVRVVGLEGDADLDTSGGSIGVDGLRGKLLAETSGGSISLKGVTGTATVATSGGSIEAEDVSGALEAGTSGGSIEVGRVGGDARLETSGGSIRVSSAGGKVYASSSAGQVDVTFAKGNATGGSLDTSAGGIRVALDASVDLTIHADTSAGSIRADLPLEVSGDLAGSRISGRLNRGGALLKLHTSAGSIRIERLD